MLCFDASRLARNGRDWHYLLELCGLVEARVIDLEGVYDPCRPNDRLLLGMKGSISEFELGMKSTGIPGQLPANCKLARLLMTDGNVLPKAERGLIAHLLIEVAPVAAAITVAKQLNALLRRKTSESLTQILDAAITTPLKDFTADLRRDITAIQAALDLPWTTSPVWRVKSTG